MFSCELNLKSDIYKSVMKNLIKYFAAKPKQLFLLDFIGALVTASILATVCLKFREFFGMPEIQFSVLVAIACMFAIYSGSCFLFLRKNWRTFIRIVAIANLLYCCLTIGLIFNFYSILTPFGIFYFVAEVLVILVLVTLELKTASALLKIP